jgi:hypothetical protein
MIENLPGKCSFWCFSKSEKYISPFVLNITFSIKRAIILGSGNHIPQLDKKNGFSR